jgi:hypothetical protein
MNIKSLIIKAYKANKSRKLLENSNEIALQDVHRKFHKILNL